MQQMWRNTFLTCIVGIVGGYVFVLAGLPAPWLSGSMVGIALAMGVGLRPVMPDPLRDTGMLFAGLVLGSSITPEMVQAIGRYPISLAILAITTIIITMAGRAMLMRFWRWDGDAALFASLPGAMSAVLATAAEKNVDMLRVATVQSIRMFILIALLPSVVVVSVGANSLQPAKFLSIGGFAVTALLGLALALLFERLRIFSPFLLGGMAIAAILHVTNLQPGSQPALIAEASMLLIGVFVGSRFSDLKLRTLLSLVVPGLALFAITTMIAVIGAVITWKLTATPLPEALVAFAPGGLEAMVILGIVLGLDPLYVASHHIARFLMVALGLPFVARWALKKPD